MVRLPVIDPATMEVTDERDVDIQLGDMPGVGDNEEERAIAAMINRATHAREAQAEQEARLAELNRERNFYRDSLRRILGVTRIDGEALIELIKVRLRNAYMQAADVCTDIEEHLDIKRTDPDEPLRERLVRVGLIVVEMLDARRRADNRSKRWQARVRKAEARVVVLEKMAEDLTVERDAMTEERNGLTLRRGEAAKQIAKRKGGRK